MPVEQQFPIYNMWTPGGSWRHFQREVQEVRNYLAKMLFASFTILTFALMVQNQW